MLKPNNFKFLSLFVVMFILPAMNFTNEYKDKQKRKWLSSNADQKLSISKDKLKIIYHILT